jgi:hypothetical protein
LVLSAWLAAPVPRPPQPMRPTLISSLPAAQADWATVSALAAAVVPINWRRDVAAAGVVVGVFMDGMDGLFDDLYIKPARF